VDYNIVFSGEAIGTIKENERLDISIGVHVACFFAPQ
jgi:hypothetical protein